MNSIDEILNQLPTLEVDVEKKHDKQAYKVMADIAEAIHQKYYPVSARINQVTRFIDLQNDVSKIVNFFYLTAPIVQGYSYLLFEAIHIKNDFYYPVHVTLFGDDSIELGIVNDSKEFEQLILSKVFNTPFFKSLVSHILSNFDKTTFSKQKKDIKIQPNSYYSKIIFHRLESPNMAADLMNETINVITKTVDGKTQKKPFNTNRYLDLYARHRNVILTNHHNTFDIPKNCVEIELNYQKENLVDEITLTYSLV